MVHWRHCSDPIILPINTQDENSYVSSPYNAHLPPLLNFSKTQETLQRTMTACARLKNQQRASKDRILTSDTGKISKKERDRKFLTLGVQQSLPGLAGAVTLLFPLCVMVIRLPVIRLSTKYFCPFCKYTIGNGHMMNDYLHSHISLAGVCGHCLDFTMTTHDQLFTAHWRNDCWGLKRGTAAPKQKSAKSHSRH